MSFRLSPTPQLDFHNVFSKSPTSAQKDFKANTTTDCQQSVVVGGPGNISLGIFPFGSSALTLSFAILRFGDFAWELSLGSLGLGASVCDLWLRNFRLGYAALKLSLRRFRIAWEFSFGNFGFRISGLGN